MRTVACTTIVSRSPEALFDFMLNAEFAPEWRAHVSRMEWLDPPAAGARLRLTFWSEGRERSQELTMLAHAPPQHYAFLNHTDGSRLTTGNTIEPAGDGSRLTCTLDLGADSIWGRVLLPLIRRQQRIRFAGALAPPKAAAEKSQ